ncbi:MAG: B3/B4 domain-containing protein [Armatimonadota bacterium]
MIEVRVDVSVSPLVRIGIVEAEGVTVIGYDSMVWNEIDAVTARLRTVYEGREPAHIEGLQPARDLYRRIGVDPTKLRPSSEALLRRVLRGDGLPRINSLVDISNLCSLECLLPIGLHDLDRASGAFILRRGTPGEGYHAIGKGRYSVEERLTAADDQGPCGSPTSDSQRTMITPATRRCLMIIYAPISYDESRLGAHVDLAATRLARFAGGAIVQTGIR